MNAVKHTPGPFKVLKGSEEDPDRCFIVSAGPVPYHIATIENGQPGDCVETELATAQLFAAAPELLEALESVLEYTKGMEGCEDWPALRDTARAAIAKAEGKEGA